jgi:hypothetical protein
MSHSRPRVRPWAHTWRCGASCRLGGSSEVAPVMNRALMSTALLLTALGGCSSPKETAPKPCCEQPKIPAGVPSFVIVADDVTGPSSDARKVQMRAALSGPTKRDQLYPVLHTVYRHAMTRTAFEPLDFRGEIYESEAAARAGGPAGRVASIFKGQSDTGPRCENDAKYDFTEQAERAFAAVNGRLPEENPNDSCHLDDKKPAARVDDAFTHKPALKVDPAAKAVEVTHPYLQMDKDEWVPELRRNAALLDWSDYMTTLFRRVEGLQRMVFVGVHREEPVVKITVTRDQFDNALSSLREEISSHAATTFASLGTGASSDKEAQREQEAFKAKTYKAAMAVLPKAQVFVSPKLK